MMSSTTDQDPFLQVQSDVLTTLQHTRPLFTSFLRIRSLSTTPNSPELLSAKTELETCISSLLEDIEDLKQSIKAIQVDPYKYGLEIEEVSRRERWVLEVGGEVEDIRDEIAKISISVSSAPTKGKGKGKGNGNGNGNGYPDEGDTETPDYNAEFEHQQQLHIMAEQDTTLDSVFHTVGNLRQQADDMGRELEEQGEMLEVVDGVADRVGGKLQGGLKSMGGIIRRNEDRWSSCCIGVLIFVLVLLLILVLVL